MSKYQTIEDCNRSASSMTASYSCWDLLQRRYQRTQKCVSSKATLIILMWLFLVLFTFCLNLLGYSYVFEKLSPTDYDIFNAYYFTIIILTYWFYPVAGYLADIKFGRFKMVLRSLYSLILFLVAFSLMFLLLFYLIPEDISKYLDYFLLSVFLVVSLLFVVNFVSLNANFIQLGMDQLHDSPEGHQSLFIHWYVWVFQLFVLVAQLMFSPFVLLKPVYFLIMFIPVILLLILTIFVAKKNQNWFFIDQVRSNPYSLVCAVTKFAHRHKVPIRRSAFTYCEDEIPSGLDLGKNKYGGPFTTEQVEDVKAFYRILKVLLTLGPVWALNSIGGQAHFYIDAQFNQIGNSIFEMIPQLLVFISIPLYVCLIRPFIYYCLPGILKRIGLGIIAMGISMICTSLIFETAFHLENAEIECPFPEVAIKFNSSADSGTSVYYYYATIFPKILESLSTILFQIAYYEFICSQTPNSMKGFMIGLSFAIKGTFHIFIYCLLIIFSQVHTTLYLSCGMYYYLICICSALVSFLAYVKFAKKYQFRKRDEICPVYQYAEEYYSRRDDNSQDD